MPKKQKKADKSNQKKISKRGFRWRKNPKIWTDTLFEKRLLDNPALMTNGELVSALDEYQEWRKAQGKYSYHDDPFEEGAETEPPFSPKVLSNIIYEAMYRLMIGEELAMGRFKKSTTAALKTRRLAGQD